MRFYHPEPTEFGFAFKVEWGGTQVPVHISNEAIAADARARDVDLSKLAYREAEFLDTFQADLVIVFGDAAFARGPVTAARLVPRANGHGVQVELM